METAKTESRPKKTSSLSDAERLNSVLYKSSVRELDVTSSWEEIVLITAAKIAEIKNPVIRG